MIKTGVSAGSFDLFPRKCKTCGKRFEAGKEYVYKIGHDKKRYKWFCSYHCMREFQKGEDKRETGRRYIRRQEIV